MIVFDENLQIHVFAVSCLKSMGIPIIYKQAIFHEHIYDLVFIKPKLWDVRLQEPAHMENYSSNLETRPSLY